MQGNTENLEKLAASGAGLIIDCKDLTAVSLLRIVRAGKAGQGILTLTNIKGKSMDALLEIAAEGKERVIFDTR